MQWNDKNAKAKETFSYFHHIKDHASLKQGSSLEQLEQIILKLCNGLINVNFCHLVFVLKQLERVTFYSFLSLREIIYLV